LTEKTRLYIIIPLVAFLIAFLGRTAYYYRGFYVPPNVPASEVEGVEILSEPQQSVPIIADGDSVVLVDNSHLNKFSDEEMTTLFGRITAAGGRVEIILPLHDAELEERLRGAVAFVVLANQEFYEVDELIILEKFVRNGGRLMIVGEPTRVTFVNAINSIAGHFGVIYQDDYIYSLVKNDGNYLNVILSNFAENPITEGVNQIVVRSAHSIRTSEDGLVFGDEDTFSSLRETPGDVTVAALTTDGNVLALPDLTFLTGPYNTFADNDIFIDNIVAFLLGGERSYELLDFPHFFDDSVELVFTESAFLQDSFSATANLRQRLEDAGIAPHQDDNLLPGESALVISEFSGLDSSLRDLLIDEGIRVNTVGELITLRDVGELDRSNSVLLHLKVDDDGRYQLFILADTAEALERGISLLLDGGLERCTLRPETAFCSADTLATPTVSPTPSRTPIPSATPSPTGEEAVATPDTTPTAQ
jgi:hypothetical protein